MRKYYWYLTAYARKHGKIILGSVLIAVVIFSLVIPTLIKAIERKPRQYIGLVGDFSLDNLPEEVAKLISVGLTTAQPDGTVGPGLATRWVIEQDGRSYRFILKENIKWHDGRTVQPADLSYNFRGVSVITNPNDIVFQLPEQFVPFPSVVARPIITFINERYLMFFSRRLPIGVGGYRVVDYRQDNNRLKEIVLDGQEKRLIYRFYLTEDQAVTAYKQGKVDVLVDLAAQHDIFGWSTARVEKTLRTDRYLAVFFDNNNRLFDKNVRQAFAYALPKPADESRAIGPIGIDSWVYLETAKSYDYDLDRAFERILDNLPPEPLSFELTTTANFQGDAEAIKQAWEEFGRQAIERCQKSKDIEDKNRCQNAAVAVTIHISNFPDTTDFQALLVGQEIPLDPDQYFLWHSQQQTNFTHYKNTRIDALLEKGRKTVNAAERLAIYQEFQQFFLEDAPAVFIRYLPSYTVTRK